MHGEHFLCIRISLFALHQLLFKSGRITYWLIDVEIVRATALRFCSKVRLAKRHGHAGIAREEGLQNRRSLGKMLHNVLWRTNIKNI